MPMWWCLGRWGLGLLAEAPFEGIMVTAAAHPAGTGGSTGSGGTLVIPVDAVDAVQNNWW